MHCARANDKLLSLSQIMVIDCDDDDDDDVNGSYLDDDTLKLKSVQGVNLTQGKDGFHCQAFVCLPLSWPFYFNQALKVRTWQQK